MKMSWIPWLLLILLAAAQIWIFIAIKNHLYWAQLALRGDKLARRPQGWLVRTLGIQKLVTEIEESAAKELEEHAIAARRIEILLAPLTDAVLVVDAQDRLRLANPAAVALFELEEKDLGESVVPLVRSAEFGELIRLVRTQGDVKSTVLLNRTPLSDVWIQVAGSLTDTETFGESAAIFVLADVTALKRLQSLEREFVTNVSHDLRTPVTILRGYTETLAEDHTSMSVKDRTRFIQKILNSVGRLQSLVEGLLAIASLETSQKIYSEAGALDLAVREVADEFGPRFTAAGVRIELHINSCDGGAADPIQVRRLVQNLIDNALAHATGMTRLLVTTCNQEKGTYLIVEDDGIGVAQADLPRLFDRFYRADKSRKTGGSGLGLSIVRQVAELHGGSVFAENVHPKGLRVTVLLPHLLKPKNEDGLG